MLSLKRRLTGLRPGNASRGKFLICFACQEVLPDGDKVRSTCFMMTRPNCQSSDLYGIRCLRS